MKIYFSPLKDLVEVYHLATGHVHEKHNNSIGSLLASRCFAFRRTMFEGIRRICLCVFPQLIHLLDVDHRCSNFVLHSASSVSDGCEIEGDFHVKSSSILLRENDTVQRTSDRSA